MLTCGVCKKKKPESEFHFRDKLKGTRKSWCKNCASTLKKAWYQKNRVKYRKLSVIWNRKHKEDLRDFILDYLSHHPCVDCGETDIRVLEFDHEDEKLKTASISKMIQGCLSLSTIIKEIDKCSVRCCNCHRKRTIIQFNWYKNGSVDKLVSQLPAK